MVWSSPQSSFCFVFAPSVTRSICSLRVLFVCPIVSLASVAGVSCSLAICCILAHARATMATCVSDHRCGIAHLSFYFWLLASMLICNAVFFFAPELSGMHLEARTGRWHRHAVPIISNARAMLAPEAEGRHGPHAAPRWPHNPPWSRARVVGAVWCACLPQCASAQRRVYP